MATRQRQKHPALRAKKRLRDGSEPFLTRTRKIQNKTNGPRLNLTGDAAELLGLEQSTEMELFIFSDGIWVQRADHDREE
jgi:hypothetical protein